MKWCVRSRRTATDEIYVYNRFSYEHVMAESIESKAFIDAAIVRAILGALRRGLAQSIWTDRYNISNNKCCIRLLPRNAAVRNVCCAALREALTKAAKYSSAPSTGKSD